MGIYIKGMKMPSKADACIVIRQDGLVKYYGQLSEFRAVEVPDGHGRLIDADRLKETLDYYIREAGWGEEINKALGWVKDEFIDSEATVIPAVVSDIDVIHKEEMND